MAKGKYPEVKERFSEIQYLLEVEGYNEKQVIEHLGVHKSTFYDWKKNKPEFSDLLKKSKRKVISELKETALKVVRGYYYTETTTEVKTIDGQEYTSVKTVEKYAQPDKTILIFMLANLDSKNWRRQDKEHVDDKKEKSGNKHMKSADDILMEIEEDE